MSQNDRMLDGSLETKTEDPAIRADVVHIFRTITIQGRGFPGHTADQREVLRQVILDAKPGNHDILEIQVAGGHCLVLDGVMLEPMGKIRPRLIFPSKSD